MMPIPPPNSVLLDRLKKFLPEIAQANDELDKKIQRDGAESVRIDLTMEPVIVGATSSEQGSEAMESAMPVESADSNPKKKKALIQVVGEGESDGSSEEEDDVAQDSAAMGQRVIELNFALGDFDETPIAKLEDTAMNQDTDGEHANN